MSVLKCNCGRRNHISCRSIPDRFAALRAGFCYRASRWRRGGHSGRTGLNYSFFPCSINWKICSFERCRDRYRSAIEECLPRALRFTHLFEAEINCRYRLGASVCVICAVTNICSLIGKAQSIANFAPYVVEQIASCNPGNLSR